MDLTQKEMAEVLGLSTRQVANLEVLGMPTKSKAGKKLYPSTPGMRWYIHYKVQAAQPADFEEARARKMSAEAELAELDLAQKRGQLIPLEQHGQRLARILERVRARLVAIPGTVAPRLLSLETAVEAQAVVAGAVAEALEELSRG